MKAKVIRYCGARMLLLLMCGAAWITGFCQQSYPLTVHYLDSPAAALLTKADVQTSFTSKAACEAYVTRLPELLLAKGFIASSLDSFYFGEKNAVLLLYLGQTYTSLQLTVPAEYALLAQAAGWNGRQTQGTFNFANYAGFNEKLLDLFEDAGFPFAKIQLDSVQINNDKVSAQLKIDRGYPYRIDSIRVFGPARISRTFIHRYLDIAPGSAYSRRKLNSISQRLSELPYLEQTRPWDVTMLNTGSLVNLYLQPRRSNQVNVLAGFLPANQQLGGKLLFTIDATLRLQNAFGTGETVGLIWQQIQPKSPRLNLQYTQPYLFNSPFGVDFLFDLLKKDSAFLNINAQLGVLYALSTRQTAKLILQSRRSNILDTDTNTVKSTRRLPDVADVGSFNLGVEYEWLNTDYRFNPRMGSEVTVSVLAGNKTIRKNNAVLQLKDPSFDYNRLYDTVRLTTYQLRSTIRASHYFPIGKQTALKTGLQAGIYESPQYFRNELFQIGGYKTLRGFDEESIYANQYVIGTFEYRYLLDRNSNFFAFTDFGWSNNKLFRQSNTYIGTGIGLSFQTKTGIFNLSYAVGKRNDLELSLRQSKIHFGFVSIF